MRFGVEVFATPTGQEAVLVVENLTLKALLQLKSLLDQKVDEILAQTPVQSGNKQEAPPAN